MKTWVKGGELCDSKFQKQGRDTSRAPHSLFTSLRNTYRNRKKIGFMSFFFSEKFIMAKFFVQPSGQGEQLEIRPALFQSRASG